ncbi:MAG: DUF1542 domain-containing protein [Clostridiales bacterium]|nr:DUF1542 domain-containing protein [Clostridiales bacterium]
MKGKFATTKTVLITLLTVLAICCLVVTAALSTHLQVAQAAEAKEQSKQAAQAIEQLVQSKSLQASGQVSYGDDDHALQEKEESVGQSSPVAGPVRELVDPADYELEMEEQPMDNEPPVVPGDELPEGELPSYTPATPTAAITVATDEDFRTYWENASYDLITLTADITLTKSPAELRRPLTVDLNDHVLTLPSKIVLYVMEGGELTLQDTAAVKTEHTVKAYERNQATLTDVTITGGVVAGVDRRAIQVGKEDDGVYDGGVFNLVGGTIAGVSGDAVIVMYCGTFNMSGGEVSHNRITNNALIYIHNAESEMYMTGGTVTENYSSRGVEASKNGTIYMSGGTICNNTVTTFGGVNVSPGTFNMSGGEIYGNTAPYGGMCIQGTEPVLNMSGGKIHDNIATTVGASDVSLLSATATFRLSGTATANIALLANITLDASQSVSGNVVIDLNNHNLVLDEYRFTVINSGVLTLRDSAEEKTEREVSAFEPGATVRSEVTIEGGVFVCTARSFVVDSAKGVLNLEGGTIAGAEGDAIVCIYSGKFNMSGGAVRYNCCNKNCMLHVINSGAVMNITGGVISDNSSLQAALCVRGSAALNFSGCIVTNNTILGDCGCVDVEGTANINGGEITGNTSKHGGGVYVRSGTVNFNGGTISDNTATESGGGVYVYNGTANFNGSTITNNTATEFGPNVCIDRSTAKLGFNGNSVTTIWLNTNCTLAANSEIKDGADITLDLNDHNFLLTNYTLAVSGGRFVLRENTVAEDRTEREVSAFAEGETTRSTLEFTGGVVVGGNAPAFLVRGGNFYLQNTYLVSVDADYAVGVSGGNFYLQSSVIGYNHIKDARGAEVYVTGGAFCFTGIAKANYLLGGDAGIAANCSTNQEIWIDLNDHVLTTDKTIFVDAEGNLTIQDTAATKTEHTVQAFQPGSKTRSAIAITGGAIAGSGTVQMFTVRTNGTLNLLSGSIVGANTPTSAGSAIRVSGGTFNMFDGAVSYNVTRAGSVCVADIVGGVFNMSGGEVSYNTGNEHAGGVSVHVETTFNMTGGTIKGNTTLSTMGGGLFVEDNATANIYEGTITENTAPYGGGIYARRSGTIYFIGGTITDNESTQAGLDVYIADANVKIRMSGSTTGITFGVNYSFDTTHTLTGAFTLDLNDKVVSTGDLVSDETMNRLFNVTNGGSLTIQDLAKTKTDHTISAYAKGEAERSDVTVKGGVIGCGSIRLVHVYSGSVVNFEGGTVAGINECTLLTYGGVINMSGGAVSYNYILNVIMYVNDGGTLNMTGGVVSNNTTRYGGGVCINNGTFNMSGGSIIDNTATMHGGGVRLVKGTFTMEGEAVISNNTAPLAGGVYVEGGIFNMKGGIISGNTATTMGGGVYIKAGTFNMTDGKIEANKQVENGGGLYVAGGTTNMSGGAISGNEAINGAGVYVKAGTFNLQSEAVINGNKATGSGGGVYYAGGAFKMTGGEISGNTASTGGGLFLTNNLTFDFTIGTISGNTATSNGGGVFVNSGTFNLNGGEINGKNKAVSGGGVFVAGGILNVINGAISGNEATNGGGVYYTAGAFVMTGGEISGNTATQDGAGVFVTGNMTFTLKGGTISDNTATRNGGGVYIASGALTMSEGAPEISDNHAVLGAGVYLGQGTITIASGSISANDASESGGGVYVNNGTFAFSAGTITENTAENGAGVYINDGAFNMSGSATISANEATTGGGVYVNGGTYALSAGNVIENKAVNGAGVYVAGATTKFSFTGGTISANEASENGGGVYLASGGFTMSHANAKINGNKAVDGAGVYVAGGTFAFSAGTISANVASESGGGVYANGGTSNFTGGTISGNTATDGFGGGLYVASSSLCQFSGTPVIKDNHKDTDIKQNIYVAEDAYIKITGLITSVSGSLGITVNEDRIFTNNVGGYQPTTSRPFVSDIEGKCISCKEGELGFGIHDPAVWRWDNNDHWYECANCHEQATEKAPHEWAWTVTEDGQHSGKCDVCPMAPTTHAPSDPQAWTDRDATQHSGECGYDKCTLTVSKDHVFMGWKGGNTGTHTNTCVYESCGYVQSHEARDPLTWTSNNKSTHSGLCSRDDCTITITKNHTWGQFERIVSDGSETMHVAPCTADCGEAEEHKEALSSEWKDDDADNNRVSNTHHADCSFLGCDIIVYAEHNYNSNYLEVDSDDTYHWRSCLTCGHEFYQRHYADDAYQLVDTGDGENHVGTCSICGRQAAKAPHVVAEGTQPEAGYYYHTFECSVCVASIGSEDHGVARVFHDWSTLPYTHDEDGNHWRYCPDCAQINTNTKQAHRLVETAKVDATCKTSGTQAYWQCQVCDEYFSDADGKLLIEEKISDWLKSGGEGFIPVNSNGHVWSEWIDDSTRHQHFKECTLCYVEQDGSRADHVVEIGSNRANLNGHEGTCVGCGKLVIANHKAAEGETYKDNHDVSAHWYVCETCNAEFGRVTHNWEQIAATWTTAKEYHYKTCDVCTQQNQQAHNNIYYVTERLEPICTPFDTANKAGHKGYSNCTICSTYFDEDGEIIYEKGSEQQTKLANISSWTSEGGEGYLAPKHDINERGICNKCYDYTDWLKRMRALVSLLDDDTDPDPSTWVKQAFEIELEGIDVKTNGKVPNPIMPTLDDIEARIRAALDKQEEGLRDAKDEAIRELEQVAQAQKDSWANDTKLSDAEKRELDALVDAALQEAIDNVNRVVGLDSDADTYQEAIDKAKKAGIEAIKAIVPTYNPEHEHSWSGNWTKNDKAHWLECTDPDCNETYGYAEHYLDETSRNITVKGSERHQGECADCGYVILEEHKASTNIQGNVNAHWVNCEVCGYEMSRVAHEWSTNWTLDQENKNQHYQKCNVCQFVYTQSHDYQKSAAVPGICSYDGSSVVNGVKEYFTCTGCGENFFEKEGVDGYTYIEDLGEWKTTGEGVWVPDHSLNEKGVCTVCDNYDKWVDDMRSLIEKVTDPEDKDDFTNRLDDMDRSIEGNEEAHASQTRRDRLERDILEAINNQNEGGTDEKSLSDAKDEAYRLLEEAANEKKKQTEGLSDSDIAKFEEMVDEALAEAKRGVELATSVEEVGDKLSEGYDIIEAVEPPVSGGEDHVHNWATDYTTDDNGHWYACLNGCNERREYSTHEWGAYESFDTVHVKTCDICEKSVTENHTSNGNDYRNADNHNNTGHWLVCSVCENNYKVVIHTWSGSWLVDSVNGLHYQECPDCGQIHSENHVLTETSEQPADCKTGIPGVKAYWHCEVCNNYFSDSKAKSVITGDLLNWKQGAGKINPEHTWSANHICSVCGECKEAVDAAEVRKDEVLGKVADSSLDESRKKALTDEINDAWNNLKSVENSKDPQAIEEAMDELNAALAKAALEVDKDGPLATAQQEALEKLRQAYEDALEDLDGRGEDEFTAEQKEEIREALKKAYEEDQKRIRNTSNVDDAIQAGDEGVYEMEHFIENYEFGSNPDDGHQHVWFDNFDNTNHWQECSKCNARQNIEAHKAAVGMDFHSNGSETHMAYCSVCMNQFKQDHSIADDATYTVEHSDATGHWKVCQYCDQALEKQDHVWNTDLESGNGSHFEVCRECGARNGQLHTLETIARVDSTCNSYGTLEYYKCVGCNKYFSDVDGMKEIENIDLWLATDVSENGGRLPIDSTYGHVWGEWKDDTYTHEHYRHCTLCNIEDTVNRGVHAVTSATAVENSNNHKGYCEGCGLLVEMPHSKGGDVRDEGNHDASGHWTSCEVCGEKINFASHTDSSFVPGDNGTHYKVCPDCGQVYGESAHDMVADSKPATTEHDGYKTFYTCSDCGASYSDSEGINAIDPEDWKTGEGYLEQLEGECSHSYENKFDSKQHWQECSLCGDRQEENDHSAIRWTVTADGKHEWSCDECDYSISEAHTMTYNKGKVATCGEYGYKASYTCSECEANFEDVNGLIQITMELDTWRTTEGAGRIELDTVNGHVYEDKHNVVAHWKECSECHTVQPGSYVTHDWNKISYKCDETADASGKHWKECPDCKEKYDEREHAFQYFDEVKATTEANGCKAYKLCVLCGQAYDENDVRIADLNAWKIDENGGLLKKLDSYTEDPCEDNNHSYVYRYYEGSASHYEECTICGDVKVYDDPSDGLHTYDEMIKDAVSHYKQCTKCGYREGEEHKLGAWTVDDGANPATHVKTCSVCGYVALEEEHKLVAVAGQAPDCSNAGFESYFYCKDCDTYFSKVDYTKIGDETDLEGWKDGLGKIPNDGLSHVWSGWKDDGKGNHYVECLVCGATDLQDKHVLTSAAPVGNGHQGVCTICGLTVTMSHVTDGESYDGNNNHDVSGHWFNCAICHAKAEFEDHDWSTGDWIVSADGHYKKCATCGQEYERAAHTLRAYAEQPATQSENGHYAYWQCLVCGTYYSNSDCADEHIIPNIDEWLVTDGLIPAGSDGAIEDHVHQYEKRNFDANYHWYECSTCGAIDPSQEKEEHNVYWVVNADGTHTKRCRTCPSAFSYTEQHAMTYVPAVAAKCNAYGVKAYYTCECGGVFEDVDGLKAIANLENWKQNEGRIDYDTVNGHEWSDTLSHDVFGHWIECKVEGCGAQKPGSYVAHDWDNIEYKTNDGKHYKECECGQKYDEAAHALTKTNRIEPTDKEYGYLEYYQCTVCGIYYKDAEGKQEIGDQEAFDIWHNTDGRLDRLVYEPGACDHEGYLVYRIVTDPETGVSKHYQLCTKCGYTSEEVEHSSNLLAYSYDAASHWYECECGYRINEAAHKWSAWAHDTGKLHYRYCLECLYGSDEAHGGRVVEQEHHLVANEGKAATCKDFGYKPYYYCADCGIYFKDVECAGVIGNETALKTWLESEGRIGKDITNGHVWGDWSNDTATQQHYRVCTLCGVEDKANRGAHVLTKAYKVGDTHQGVCDVCGITVTMAHVTSGDLHDANNHDSTGHWLICTVCGERTAFAGHSYGDYVEQGSNHARTCTECGYVLTEAHKLAEMPGKDATCRAPGYNKYWYCATCGTYFADESGSDIIGNAEALANWKTGRGATEIDESAHVWSTLYTGDVDGHWLTCTVCGTKNDSSYVSHVWAEDQWTDGSNGKHYQVCDTCKFRNEQDHEYEWSNGGNDIGHTGECKYCDNTVTEGHAWSDWTTEDGKHVRTCSKCEARDEHEINVTSWTNVGDKHQGDCDDCGTTVEEAHEWAEDYSSDNDGHWYACKYADQGCDAKHEYAAHQVSSWTDKDGTNHVGKCDVCSKEDVEQSHKLIWVQETTGHYQKCDVEGCEYTTNHGQHTGVIWKDNGDNHTGHCTECGMERAQAAHKWSDWAEGVAEDLGKHVRTCEDCGKKETHVADADSWTSTGSSEHEGPCNGGDGCELTVTKAHTLGEWKLTEDGSKHYRECTAEDCEYKTEEEGHKWSAWTEGEGEDEGKHVRTCDDCSKKETHEPKLEGVTDWTPVEGTNTHEGTCAEDGCELKVTEEHSFGAWAEGEGEDEGKHVRTCDKCGAKETHDADEVVDGKWTPSEDGVHHEGTCAVDGCNVTVKKAHDFEGKYYDDGDGKHHQECKDCEYETEPVEHSFGAWAEGEGEDEGKHVRTCDDCGAKETHDANAVVDDEWTPAGDKHEGTCVVEGCELTVTADHEWRDWSTTGAEKHSRTCSKCETTEEVAHTWSEWKEDSEGKHYRECTDECGYAMEHEAHSVTLVRSANESGHTGPCAVCGKEVTVAHVAKGSFTDSAYHNENGHWSVCAVCREQYDYTPHVWSDIGWTAEDGEHFKKCETCEQEYGRATHTMGDGATKVDNVNHEGTCSVCSEPVTEAHSFNETTHVCSVCDALDEEFKKELEDDIDQAIKDLEKKKDELQSPEDDEKIKELEDKIKQLQDALDALQSGDIDGDLDDFIGDVLDALGDAADETVDNLAQDKLAAQEELNKAYDEQKKAVTDGELTSEQQSDLLAQLAEAYEDALKNINRATSKEEADKAAADGAKELERLVDEYDPSTTPGTGHTHTWKPNFNNDSHWDECESCGMHKNEAPHTDSKWLVDEAGNHYKYCEDCGNKYLVSAHVAGGWQAGNDGKHVKNCVTCGTELTSEEHKLQRVAEVPATCTAIGHKAYYICSTCASIFSDANGTSKIENLDEWKSNAGRIDALGHEFDETTGICTRCGQLSEEKQQELEDRFGEVEKKIEDRIEELEGKDPLTPEEEKELEDLKKRLEDLQKKLEDLLNGEGSYEDTEKSLDEFESALGEAADAVDEDGLLAKAKEKALQEIEQAYQDELDALEGRDDFDPEQKAEVEQALEEAYEQAKKKVGQATTPTEAAQAGGYGKGKLEGFVDNYEFDNGGNGAHTHVWSKDWMSDGVSHWKECSVCGARRDVAEHVLDSATANLDETHSGTCTICGADVRQDHVWSDEWTIDADGHWHECLVCGAKSDYAGHSVSEWISDGYESHRGVCDVCGEEIVHGHNWLFGFCTVCGDSLGHYAGDNEVGVAAVAIVAQLFALIAVAAIISRRMKK